ncbi:hypothetical protein JCM16161A_10750 [Vulcanisaeta sp. JCM 16161]
MEIFPNINRKGGEEEVRGPAITTTEYESSMNYEVFTIPIEIEHSKLEKDSRKMKVKTERRRGYRNVLDTLKIIAIIIIAMIAGFALWYFIIASILAIILNWRSMLPALIILIILIIVYLVSGI